MSTDAAVSVALLAGLVALCEASRTLLSRALARAPTLSACAAELVSTFQLCCCTRELKMLSEVGGVEPRLALTLTYVASVVHAFTFRGAVGNPCGALEHAHRARLPRGCALRRIACQFAAAAAARVAVPLVWALGLSGVHARHALRGFRCVSPVHAPLYVAAAAELACAFAVQTVITHTRQVEQKYRVHAVAAVITWVVYAGGGVSGAVFNPAVAFSTQFPCSGPSFLDHCLVYWLGPLIGVAASVLLSDHLLPVLWTTPSSLHLLVDAKKET
ncbi:unnamed protein product [Ophioblennius macclurei]